MSNNTTTTTTPQSQLPTATTTGRSPTDSIDHLPPPASIISIADASNVQLSEAIRNSRSSTPTNAMPSPQLILSAWEGFHVPEEDNTGPEKRLEIDVRSGLFLASPATSRACGGESFPSISNASSVGSDQQQQQDTGTKPPPLGQIEPEGATTHANLLANAFARALDVENPVIAHHDNGLSFMTDGILIVVKPTKIIFTSSAWVPLHRFVADIVKSVQDNNLLIEWASFMDKNTVSPWSDIASGQLLASQYACLKDAWPKGESFMIGQLDGDHYFYFVYDNLDRSPSRKSTTPEVDMQVNLIMYGFDHKKESLKDLPAVLEGGGTVTSSISCPTPDDSPARVRSGESSDEQIPSSPPQQHKRRSSMTSVPVHQRELQYCTFDDKGEYETLRLTIRDDPKENIAAFEMDKELAQHGKRLDSLVTRFQPDRFVLMVLMDPHTETGAMFGKGKSVGIESFDGYERTVRYSNAFRPGYYVVQHSFVRNINTGIS